MIYYRVRQAPLIGGVSVFSLDWVRVGLVNRAMTRAKAATESSCFSGGKGWAKVVVLS
jgi:hypothetical protein